jgi:hypothetical protein
MTGGTRIELSRCAGWRNPTAEQRRRGDQQDREHRSGQHRAQWVAEPHRAAGKQGAEPAGDFGGAAQRADRSVATA